MTREEVATESRADSSRQRPPAEAEVKRPLGSVYQEYLRAGGKDMEHVQDLRLQIESGRRLRDRAFGAVVRNGGAEPSKLAIPNEVADVLDLYAITTASGFLCYVRDHSGTASMEFNLPIEEVRQKTGELAEVLRGHVTTELLEPRKPLNVGFGLVIDK